MTPLEEKLQKALEEAQERNSSLFSNLSKLESEYISSIESVGKRYEENLAQVMEANTLLSKNLEELLSSMEGMEKQYMSRLEAMESSYKENLRSLKAKCELSIIKLSNEWKGSLEKLKGDRIKHSESLIKSVMDGEYRNQTSKLRESFEKLLEEQHIEYQKEYKRGLEAIVSNFNSEGKALGDGLKVLRVQLDGLEKELRDLD